MKNKKGFTMVELLAVVVILGILFSVTVPIINRWVGKSKNESLESQKQTLAMATQSYAQANTSVLPKAIGESKIVTAQELRDANYLKEDLKNSDDKSCMDDSKVRIYKYDQTGYRYTAYIYCEGDDVPDEVEGIKPEIDITFTDSNGSNIQEASKNVSISAIQINLQGGTTEEGEKLGINGYQYIVSVKYDDKDQEVEIFNSGSLNASGREEVVIQKSIAQYVDITKVTYFLVTVEAYNSDGGYLKKTANSNYADTDPPICGTITGQAGKDEWDKTLRSRKITVDCSDGDGSGCKQDSFTKTFNTEMDMGVITISDNAGNTTDCRVRVHLDWTTPTVTVKAYKIKKDGSRGAEVGSVTANNSSQTVTLKKYTDGYGTDSWLNKEKYPYGITYEVATSDNVILNTGVYSENTKGLKKGVNKVNDLTKKQTKSLTKNDNKMTFDLKAEGWRVGKVVVKDKALNTVTINIYAPIDRTNPTCVSSGEDKNWRKAALTLTGTCSDTMSECQKKTITKTFKDDINTTTATPGDVLDNAGNTTTCPRNQTIKIDNTPPTIPKVLLYKWKNNSTRPSSNSGLVSYTANSWSRLKIFTTHSTSTDSGVGGIYYQYKTTGTTTNATDAKDSYRNIEANGTSTIQWRACDKLGNCSKYSSSSTVKVDHEAPKCASSGGSTWTNKNVTLTGTCTDGVSGCKKDTIAKTFTSNPTNLTNQSPGTVEDNAGNKTTCPGNQTVQIDKTKPSCSFSREKTYTTGGLTITVECKDETSGCTKKTPTVYNKVTSSTSYTVSDKAGNTDTCSVKVNSATERRRKTRSCWSDSWSPWKTVNDCSSGWSVHDLTEANSDTVQYSCERCTVHGRYACKRREKTRSGGCNSWSSWGSWSTNVTACDSNTCQSESRTIYY